ncbi:putative glutathione transferase [Arabidopsis thaliana]|jgi:glutathione S-transferase|uniref:Glutathione S-transferase U8 n=3 Tax=Arabidopsis TaxID=3701 RepID=GSTU8_ARATH|nr:glutathione S-transferase TAU 8 [Arabidopsis thaliana]Q9SR36.1 RecName: Full=Glutathione S-transferase U8; Short=AtGSTU8; AltName: Full=GST class-tau member 8 [Arabidopsis thaliana]KAG7630580.1 Glutathione S-transferase C-terminal domain superfamily [Arabidopsis suecica]AAF14025.1 putative glutathione transferase [Arabidopsis thaliana]AAM63323.1 putative glutathione transferase [Arabidopsis thaliana]ABD60727.1 At3g09270 [Arabidopsis thaliana]AEE74745.1 glutathione S-transferase TAU 8 [Arab|eukprot:NP_187538.1 glutathione S-transferase TAU 8 [Arabidopsis thaliana]
MNQEEHVKLLGLWGSPFSKRVEMVLKLKGIPYEYIEEDVYGNRSPMLLKYNPIHKKVPVLIHNGRSIAESLVIVEYIEDTWKTTHTILPQDPYERAMARFWAKYVDEKVMLAVKKACWGPESEREKEVKEAYEGLKCLEKELGDKLFFGGETIGFVDIAADFIGYWLGIFQEASGVTIMTAEEFPKLQRWSEDFVGNNFIKEVLPPKEKLVAVLKAMFGSVTSN